jgi:hypothetical protein
MIKALLKSSLIASAVFAASWFRGPPTAAMIVRNFILYGILITLLAMGIGSSPRSAHRTSEDRSVVVLSRIRDRDGGVTRRNLVAPELRCCSRPHERRTGIVYRKSLRYNLFANGRDRNRDSPEKILQSSGVIMQARSPSAP